jgi:hypothetical protein
VAIGREAAADAFDDRIVLTPYAPGEDFPLFVQSRDPTLRNDAAAAKAWFQSSREALDALLLEAGALVFRGFAVGDTEAFSGWIENYESPSFGYTAGSSPRRRLAARVYESTYVPPSDIIMIHQEMSYLPTYPARVAFYCNVPPVFGGETFLADMRRITAALPAEVVTAVEERGVRYTRNFRDRGASTGIDLLDMIHRPWQDAFNTTDRDKPVADCRAMGLEAEWLEDGSLSTSYRASGFIDHPATGLRLWFNQLPTLQMGKESVLGPDRVHIYEGYYGDSRPRPYRTTYGDGGAVPEDLLEAMYATFRRHTVAFPWSQGDVLLLDNYLTAHGRNAYAGHRDIQVSLLT